MLKNYIKMAWKVMLRKKFFTFISLFGISFVLMILTVLIILIDQQIGGSGIEPDHSEALYIHQVELKSEQRWNRFSPSYYFLDHYIKRMTSPKKVAIHKKLQVTIFTNNKKRNTDLYLTDDAYWQVYQLKFTEGKPFTSTALVNASPVIVINKKMKEESFGNTDCLGKYLSIKGVNCKIIGVVDNLPLQNAVWAPLTALSEEYKEISLIGSYEATLLTGGSSGADQIKKELAQLMKKVEMTNPNKYSEMNTYADSSVEKFARTIGPSKEVVFTVIIVFMILFMLIPSINMANINISRTVERSSEIGIRKACGASIKILVYQFIVENVLLTLIGGAIGFVATLAIIYTIGGGNFLPFGIEAINWRVFVYCLLTCLFFGLLSGVYPAYKMSKMNVVEALKGGII